MTKARAATLLLLMLSSTLSVIWGFALEHSARGIIVDFKIVYYGARCLLQNRDLYNEAQITSVYLAEGGERPSNSVVRNKAPEVVALQVYFPTAFFLIAPVALLPWSVAYPLWTCITVATFTLAAFLMWTLSQDHADGASFYLICFLLANCGILFAGGNPAGLAIGLCVVAVWCFLQEKHVYAGVFCLALSLGLKPHDAGLVWLYFLLAGGAHRKRALQTLALTVALVLPAVLWVSNISPHWRQEMFANIALTDPGPNSMSESSGGMIIDLQTVISVFNDAPRFYNGITYLVFGSLLLVWMIVSVRARAAPLKDHLALAAIAALSMLPIYHRTHDTKLLLLTIPACAMLAAEGGGLGRIALLLNSGAILITSDFSLGLLAILTKDLNLYTGNPPFKMMLILLARPIPIVLLALGSFYLWLYKHRCMDNFVLRDTPEDQRHLKRAQEVSS